MAQLARRQGVSGHRGFFTQGGFQMIAMNNSPDQVSGEDQVKIAQKRYRSLMDERKRDCIALGKTWSAVSASQQIRAEHPELFEAMGVKPQGKFFESEL